MSCYSELTCSLYADHELPQEEASRVEAHLATCVACRALVEGLRAENLFLAEVMQTLEDEPAVNAMPARSASSLVRICALLIAVAAGLEAAAEWIATLIPGPLGWLNPFGPGMLWTLGFGVLNYLIEEGTAMFASAFTALALLVFALLIVRAGVPSAHRRPATIGLLTTLALVVGLSSASAVEKRTGEVITVPQNQTVNDSLLAGGEEVIIDGTVTGNLFAMAERVAVKGTVKGDLITFAQTLDVDGTVEGNVYAASKSANIRGHVAHGVYGFAGHVQLEPASQVDGEVVAGAGSVEVRGSIGKDLSVYGGALGLWRPARVGGNVEAHVSKAKDLFVEPGTVISGQTKTLLPPPRPTRFARPRFYLGQAIALASALLMGLVLYWLFPVLFAARLDKTSSALWALGTGFLVLVATPIAVLVVAITLIGLPLALLALAAWLAGLYLAKIVVAALLGRAIRRSLAGRTASFALDLLIGLAIVFVAINLPYLGGWVHFLVLLLGLGLAFIQITSRWQRVATAM
jgi:anti-sigma factor RsiW